MVADSDTPEKMLESRLRFLTGPLKGSTINLMSGHNLIGKGDDCDIYVPDARVSKHHCIIEVGEFDAKIKDLNSTNKTMLGSLEEPMALIPAVSYPLNHGDTVVVGPDVVCVFLCPVLVKGTSIDQQSLNSTFHSDAIPSRSSTALMNEDDLRETVEGLMSGMQTLYSLLGSRVANASSDVGGTSATSADAPSYTVHTSPHTHTQQRLPPHQNEAGPFLFSKREPAQ
jgi:pSer/pThr/pTyr-binding forkhead associated (FHA) protein